MYILLGLLFVLVAIAAVSGLAIRKHKRYEPIRNWMKRYQNAVKYGCDLAYLPPVPDGPWNNYPEVLEAKEQIREVKDAREARVQTYKDEREEERRRAQETLVELRLRALTIDDRQVLRTLTYSRSQLSEEDYTWVKTQLAHNAVQHVDKLLARSRDWDAEAFSQLRAFVWGKYSEYKQDTGELFTYPDDWDDMVVRLIENPQIDDFRVVSAELAGGECRLLAAESLRTESMSLGKLVLAHCNSVRWREELGDVLLAEVTKMVERFNAEIRQQLKTTTT